MTFKVEELKYALEFTKIHQDNVNNKSIREGKLLKFQVPHVLKDFEDNELVVGGINHTIVGFSPQYGGLYTYFFNKEDVEEILVENMDILNPEFISSVNQMINYWEKEATVNKYNIEMSKISLNTTVGLSYKDPGLANCDVRLAGTTPNLKKLVDLGIPGLRTEIESKKNNVRDTDFYDGLLLALDSLEIAIDKYIDEAKIKMIKNTTKRRSELTKLISVLENIKIKAPETFYEGLQLIWIYSCASDLMNYGFLSDYLGDLYYSDIQSGKIDREYAIELLTSVWNNMIKVNKFHDARIIVGGSRSINNIGATELGKTIIETSKRVKDVIPQLTMMVHENMDKELLDAAFDCIASGTTYPLLYSEKSITEVLDRTFGKEYEGLVIPFGCGEFVVEGKSVGTPNNGVNLLKALELTLYSGYDHHHKKQVGLETKKIEEIHSFEELFSEYSKQLEPAIQYLAKAKEMNYRMASEDASYLHLSLLMDNCIEKNLPMLSGGIEIKGASSEIVGIMSAADSFTCINKLVFEEQKYTLSEYVEALKNNFDGYDTLHKDIKKVVKYGNDDDVADAMAIRVFNHIAEITEEAGKNTDLDLYKIVSVSNSVSADWGVSCIASACGRLYGDAMNNANAPSIGADNSGLTALLNSMSKFDNSRHVGTINNIRISKEMYDRKPDAIKSLIKIYLGSGGLQTNITIIGKEELENAIKTPEQYANLMVRIGGFSARFVELNEVVQREIIERTTY